MPPVAGAGLEGIQLAEEVVDMRPQAEDPLAAISREHRGEPEFDDVGIEKGVSGARLSRLLTETRNRLMERMNSVYAISALLERSGDWNA